MLAPIVLAGALLAALPQQPPPTPQVSADLDAGAGLQRLDGELYGVGSAYRARFRRDGVEFLTAFGDRTPEPLPVHFTTTSIGRRGGGFAVPGSIEPAKDGMDVRYVRDGCVENWHIRPDGIEFSVEFARRPTGHGDLVVRLRVDTKLEAEPAANADESFRFAREGVGAVRFGRVFGIDAAGRRVDGTAHIDGDDIELSLPQSFVDTATYPLVLDPLVTPSPRTLGGGTNHWARTPDIAWDPTHYRFLAVWNRRFSTTTYDIVGRLLGWTGGNVSGFGTLLIRTDANATSVIPKVANIRRAETFIVLWQESNGVLARSVDAADAVMTSTITLASSAQGSISTPDIAGDSTGTTDDAVAVFWNTTQGQINARSLTKLSSAVIGSATTTIASNDRFGTRVSRPAISQTSGAYLATPRYIVTWQANRQSPEFLQIVGLKRDLTTFGPILSVFGNGVDCEEADVSGDGTDWVVAYQQGESSTTKHDIYCIGVAYDEQNNRLFQSVGPTAVHNRANDDTRNPAVAWARGSALIAFQDQSSSGSYWIQLASLDPFRCRVCESAVYLEATNSCFYPALAATHQAGYDYVVGVWQANISGSTTLARTATWRADAGFLWSLGGGCGAGGGRAVAGCGRIGYRYFQHRLRGATPNAPCALMFGTDDLRLSCGTGVLRLDPARAWIFGTATDAHGRAVIPMSIPDISAVRNYRFKQQWIVAPAGTPGCPALGVDFSNAVELRIN